MRQILLFCNILVLSAVVSGSLFYNQYPELKFSSDSRESGDALFLTKYIENGYIKTAQNLSLVKHPEISIESYAGYFTVNKQYNSNMFFWYFPAKENPVDAPVMLWLQGGPGSSSLFALFTENGPYSINSTLILTPREYSWHLEYNLVYVDNPVGAGFSFTESFDGYATNEVQVGENLLNAIQQFFLLFPNLQKNDFYISGESYAGKFIPAMGHAIYQDSKRTTVELKKPKINLKGMIIGNAFSDPINQLNFGDYFYQLGLIDTNGQKLYTKTQNHAINCLKNGDTICAFNDFNELLGSYLPTLAGLSNIYNYLKTTDDDTDSDSMGQFLNKPVTRRALHVGNNEFITGVSNVVYNYLRNDFMDTVADWISELLSHYPIMFFNGQLDIICAYPLTENSLKNLKFSSSDEYKTARRRIWRVDGDVAGYVKQAGNLTEVLVRNAGHMVPSDQPKWALDLLVRFTKRTGF